MYGEYEDKELKQLQQIELDVLKDFANVCDELELPYFMVGGSAIGTVRHKGFIPWDDDIDVGMLRKDFERFKKFAVPRLEEKYTVNTMEENGVFPVPAMFIGKKGTKFIEEAFKNLPMDFGIRIDIIPFDSVSDDEKERKKQIYGAWFWSKLYILRQIPAPNLTLKGIKKWIVRTICWTTHYTMKILCISPRWLYRQYKKYADAYNHEDTEYIKLLDYTYPTKYMMKRRDVFPTVKMNFENIQVEMPNNYDKVLSDIFGNYMELPPVEKRKNHYPHLLCLGNENERTES